MKCSVLSRKDRYIYYLSFFMESKMITDKPFKTIKEQIQILKNRNLIFLNEETAKNALSRYGYYEIINGYKDHFLNEKGNDELGFKTGTTFEHIYALYSLDKDISRDLLKALEDFEQTFKQSLAYVISENISEIDSSYCAVSHFNTGKTYGRDRRGNLKCDRARLLKRFDKIKRTDNEPFHHYSANHNNIPPWIMVKGLTFGQFLYWYRLSKPTIRHKTILRLIGAQKIFSQNDQLLREFYQLYGDIFALYLSYRNLTAHGGRVFNNRSKKHALRKSPILYNSDRINVSNRAFNKGKYRSSIGMVIYTLGLFDNSQPAYYAYVWILAELKNYLKKYPEDKDYLIKSMEFDIFPNLEYDLNHEDIKAF